MSSSLQEITIEEGSHVRLRVMGTRVDATEIVSVVTCVHTVIYHQHTCFYIHIV